MQEMQNMMGFLYIWAELRCAVLAAKAVVAGRGLLKSRVRHESVGLLGRASTVSPHRTHS